MAVLVDRAAGLTASAVKEAVELSTVALGAGLGIPLAIGATGGFMAAKSKNEDVDVDDVKREEMLRELKRLTRDARDVARRRAIRSS